MNLYEFFRNRKTRKAKKIAELWRIAAEKEKAKKELYKAMLLNANILKKASLSRVMLPPLKDLQQLKRMRTKAWEWLKKPLLMAGLIKQKPKYWVFVFLPNHDLQIMHVSQDLAGLLPLKTRTMLLNPEKVWHFGADAMLFYNYNNAEPLDVGQKTLAVNTHNPETLKKIYESKILSELLTSHFKVSSKLLLWILIIVGAVVLIIVAIKMGWIPKPGGA